MKCPHCKKEINPAAMLGSVKSELKAKTARENGMKPKSKKGGWPKGKPRKPKIMLVSSEIEAKELMEKRVHPVISKLQDAVENRISKEEWAKKPRKKKETGKDL